MLAHVPLFGRNPRGSPDFLAYPVPKACMHVLGTRVPRRLGVARSASSPKAAQALGCSLTPGLRISFGRVTCMARAASVPGLWALGFLLLACVCGWVRVAVGRGFCLPLPVVAGVSGGCVWARFVVLSPFCQLFVVFVVGLWCGPAFGTCVVSYAFPLPPAVSGSGVRCGRACWARVSAVPRPSWLGCRVVFFALFFFFFFFFLFFFFRLLGVPVPGLVVSPPVSFPSGWAAGFFFFFLLVSVPLFPLGRCSRLGVAGLGWVVPLCLFGGLVFGALWVRDLAPFCVVGGRFGGCGLFSRARPSPPPFFFFSGGGACRALPPFAFPRLAVALWLVCGVVGPSPLLAEVPVCYSPPLLAGFRCRWLWAVPATPGWGLPAAVVSGVWRWCVGGVVAGVWCGWSLVTPGGGSCVLLPATPGWVSLPVVVGGPRHSWLGSVGGVAVWCVVCGGGALVGLWLVCGVVGPSPLLAEVPVCYSPPLLAGFRCRWWWAVPATPGWGPLAAVVCGVWCVVCGGGVLVGLWLVCGVVGPSPLLAEVPVCYSPPLLAGFRCRWWWAVPATPRWGPLAALLCGVWCVAVVCWWGCGWRVVWLLPRHSWRRFLCATPRHSWLGFAAAGGGRSPPLLAGVRLRRWCVVCGVWCVAVVCWWGCGWCVVWLVPRHSWRRFLCATPRHSWLGFAASGGGRSPPLLAGVRWRRWCACFAWPGRAGRPPGRVVVRLSFSFGRFVFLLCLAPSVLGLPLSLSLLLPFLVGWGLWCVGWLLLGTCSCAVVLCVLCALSGFVAPGGRRCLAPVRVPWLWPAACLSGVPRGPAWCAAPRPVRSLSVLRSAFPTPWCLSPPRELAPPALLGGCAGHAEPGREPGSLCLPLAPAEAGALGSLRVVPVRGPAMGLSLAGPSGVGLGLRALRWLACVDPVTDASGFPYRPSFDGGLGRCTWAVSCGRRHLPLRVGERHARVPCVFACACSLGRVGRAGLPGAFWCASPFPLAALSFCFAWPPPGWGCPSLFRCCCRSSLVVFLGLPLPCSRLVCGSRLAVGCSLVVAPLPPPPFVSRGFRRSCLWPWCFFFFSPSSSSSVRPRCLRLSLVSGPGCPGPRRLRCLFCWPSASRLCVRFSLFRAFRLAVGCFRVVAAPPPLPLCVPRFSVLPLGAVCRVMLCVPGCGAAPHCCALCRPVLCCRVLCCARLVPLLVAPCPLALPVALGPCALRRCVLRCSPTLCALCCVFLVVARWCLLLFAALPCAVCVSGCCAVRSLCSPFCAVLCFALCCSCGACWCWRLVLWCSAVCCAVLCGVPWGGAGSGGPWLSAGGVLRCRCPCLAAWSASLWLVWFGGLLWCPAFLCRVLWCCAVAWCCAVVLCCRVAVLLGLALPSCGLSCCAVLCCWLAVLFLVRWWCLRAVVLFSSRCAFPVFSVLCAAVPCCAGCGALPPCVVCCGAVLGVVLCCRALLSLCGAVCVRFALLRPVVRRLCGLRCCWCLVLWRVPVRCGVSLGVLRCGGAALVCRGVLLWYALSCGVLRSVPCPAVPCCPAVLCWLAVLCGCLRCWCLFFLLSSFPLLKTPAVLPCL